MDGDIPVTLQWVSDTRLFAITSGGYRFTWLDAEVGRVEDRSIARYRRCGYAQWIVADEQLLCSFNETAVLVDPKSGELWPIRTTAADRSPGAAVSGSSFRLIGTDHIIYVSLDGELRAARYDRAKHQIGRSVSIVSGVDRDALGAATFDLAANGLLAFAPSSGTRDAQMVVMREGAAPAPLPIERAPFLRFDLSRDRRHLAAVVATPAGHELRIYDLRTGQRRVWLRAAHIRFPLWTPAGDRIAVRVENASGAALVLGSPTSSGSLDTLMSGAQATDAFDAVHFVGEHTLLARDAKHIAWHPSNVSGLYVSDYPPPAQCAKRSAATRSSRSGSRTANSCIDRDSPGSSRGLTSAPGSLWGRRACGGRTRGSSTRPDGRTGSRTTAASSTRRPAMRRTRGSCGSSRTS